MYLQPKFFFVTRWLTFCLVLFTSYDCFAGSTPRLNLITPRGIQRGREHTLKFIGERLNETQQVFLYSEGVEVLSFKQIDNRNVEVTVKVSDECRLGEHIAQLRTSRGISDFRSFYVGALEEVIESEPNNSITQNQPVSWNRTVNGTINNEDVDVFKLTGTKGQRLSVEIEAIRLGFMFDPFIAILDSKNFEIAISDDSNFARQDGVISVTLPEDGEYFVLVRESSYGGNGNCRYRLHLGDFPRPTMAFPAGGTNNETNEVTFLGDAMGILTKPINATAAAGFRPGLLYSDESGFSPSPVSFRASNLQNHFEAEPNDDRSKVTVSHPAPCAFNGIIERDGDHDYLKFSAKKGESYDIDCFARRIRSGLDPVMNIFYAKDGKHIAGDDDARRPDCYLRFNVPEDGEYLVRIRDHLRRGKSDFVYRLEVNKVNPSLSISIPRIDRYSQLRQQICVPQGNRFAAIISASRANFGGPIELMDAEWPDGMSFDARPMVPNLNLMPVVFSAAEDAPLSGKLVDLMARHSDIKANIQGSFNLRADFALGQPNNSLYFSSSVKKLAAAVTKRVPFKIQIIQPKVPLVRNGSMNLKIVAQRDEGFNEAINIQFPFRPPGLGTKPQIQIKQGESEAYYPLNANGNAQLGKWPVYAIGQSNVDGPVWVSTQLAELEIAEPYVTMEMARSSCLRGESTTIYCKLNHRTPFEGEAKAQLLGVPPHIDIPQLKFNKDTQELNFNVKTTAKSRIGKHKGLFCRVTIVQNGEPMVSTAARSELQINKPKPKSEKPSKDVSAKVKPKPAAQKPKPKSRLQQLRDAARAKAER